MDLKEAREKAGLSLETLAKATGVSAAAISRYEHGIRAPRIHIAKKLGELLGVPWYEIIDNKKAG